MKTRTLQIVLAASAVGGLVVTGAVSAGASGPNLSPASSTITATSTNLAFHGTLNGLAFTASCTGSSFSFSTPAAPTGLGPFSLGSPTFTGCTDNFGGTDTITAGATAWQATFVNATAEKVQLTLPIAGATFSTSALPGCTVTASPTAATTITANYSETTGRATIPSTTTVSFAGSGCGTVGATGTVSGAYTLSPIVTEVP
jgi:hypothetical protein